MAENFAALPFINWARNEKCFAIGSRRTAGVFLCNICSKDCGYKQNLLQHMKVQKQGNALEGTLTVEVGHRDFLKEF